MVDIIEVKTSRQMKEFAEFPCKLYKDNANYVPSLLRDDRNMCNPKKNFPVRQCKIKCFLAYKDGKIAGRIAGIIHNGYNNISNSKYIRFCRFDFIDDVEVSSKLLNAVEEFGREEGMEIIHGPWGFNDTDREGMLTFGFDKRATYATNYNYSYYPEHMASLGYEKESEWVEYKFKVPKKIDDKILRMSALIKKKFGFRDITYEMSLKEFIKNYTDEFFNVYNSCYGHLDSFVPIEGEEKKNVLKQFATIINERYFSAIVDKDNNLVAFGIIMPSIADALIKSRGKVSFGLLSAILKPKELECALIGVRPDLQKIGISVLMIEKILGNIIADGQTELESNPMLVTNSSIHAYFSIFDFDEIKKRKTFSKKI